MQATATIQRTRVHNVHSKLQDVRCNCDKQRVVCREGNICGACQHCSRVSGDEIVIQTAAGVCLQPLLHTAVHCHGRRYLHHVKTLSPEHGASASLAHRQNNPILVRGYNDGGIVSGAVLDGHLCHPSKVLGEGVRVHETCL